jgi:CheY-like chemotaxis protein
VVGTVAKRIHDKNLALTCRIVGKVQNGVIGDPVRIREILQILLSNAVKYTEKGEVVVEVSEDSREGGEAVLHFKVRDTGAGIPSERLYQMAASFDNPPAEGQPVSLRLCWHLAKLMGGRLWIDTEPGKGSTFHFTARLGLHEAVNTKLDGAAKQAITRSIRVLLGDEDEVSQKLITAILQKRGHLVVVARTHDEVFDQLSHQSFDTGVLNIDSEAINSFECANQIREQEGTSGRHTRIVGIGTSAASGERERCQAAGIDEYLVQPISADDLYRAFTTAIAVRTAAR